MNTRHPLALGLGALLLSGAPLTHAADNATEAQQTLNKAVTTRDKKGAGPAKSTNAPVIRLATPTELERLYLAGRINSKEYQKQLAAYRAYEADLAKKGSQAQALESLRQDAARPAVPSAKLPPTTSGNAAAPAPDADPAQEKLTDVEKKFDRLLEKKAAREKGSPAPAPAPEPKTKREKLDWLLRQYVDGKLTDAEYEQKRAKLIAEPD